MVISGKQVAMRCRHLLCVSFLILLINGISAFGQVGPHLDKHDGYSRLIVNGAPFLMIAGETSNSASGSLQYMETVWPLLKQTNINTALIPLCWDLIEPEEGEFDFSIVDGLIEGARANGLKIAFLWFGSWKNMVSSYAPSWIKLNRTRFPVLQDKNGGQVQMLSVFSDNNVNADARAFAALMKHIRSIDADQQTVVMMQIENEVGYNGGKRDWSDLAKTAYKSQVPKDLMSFLISNKDNLIPEFKAYWEDNGSRSSGTWAEVFGDTAEGNEIFMSYYYARYIGRVAEAGKKEYDIPMFVNASIGRQDRAIGTYPSGGPVPFVMDLWHFAAPEVDAISPDIYYGDFEGHCRAYTQQSNPLIIPETRGGVTGVARAMLAYGNHGAICFSPFGIEGYVNDPIVAAYPIFSSIAPLILNANPGITMKAVMVDKDTPVTTIVLGGYKILCEFGHRGNIPEGEDAGSALIVKTADNEFIAMGQNISLQFSLLERGRKNLVTGILECEEGSFVEGQWTPLRRINGDQIMNDYTFDVASLDGRSGNGLRFSKVGLQRVKFYNF